MKEHAREDLQRRELDTLLKFSALINSSLNIEEVLNCAMKGAEEFMDAEASSVYELDREGGTLFVRIARGEKKEPVKEIKLKLGEGVAGCVVQTGKPMVVQDVRNEKAFSDKFDKITGFKTRSMICVPLTLRDKPIGALEVLNKRSGSTFTSSDLELLTSMSQQIAVALDNAKLYRRLQKKFQLTAQELKTAHEKLLRSERVAAMGNVVQGVAHEIRNPITTIGGFARRLKKGLEGHNRLIEYVNIILEESERLENLVKEVREFAGVMSPRPTLEDPAPVLHSVISRLKNRAKEQGVAVVSKVGTRLPLTRMDVSQISKAFFNIVENALESMPQGGDLILEARQDRDQIVIRVKDTGRGIADKHLNSVYDPFFTSKTHGAGLGLTMVYLIVMNHDGVIDIKSRVGEGTTVTLRLPIST